MRISVTGSSGFVGQNLVKYLSAKFSVDVSRISRNDLSSVDFSGSFAIVHLAGKAHDLGGSVDANQYYDVNYELTKRLYDGFINSDAKVFIFVSSVKAAADSVEGLLIEDVIPNPGTHYGKSKYLAEKYILDQNLPLDKRFYILRPCMIHGPGNKGNLNLLYKLVEKGLPYPLGSFDNKRSYLSVENLCFVIGNLLCKAAIPSGIYHVSDDEAISTNEVVSILSSILARKPKILHISKPLIYAVAKMGDFFGLPFSTEKLSKLTESYQVSNNKIKEELGVELPVNTREGLLITAKSFKK